MGRNKKMEIHTTLDEEHYKKLENFKKYYGTQKEVLEKALDSLCNELTLDDVNEDESYWLKVKRYNAAFISKKSLLYLLENDIESFTDKEGCKRAIELVKKKPVVQLDLKEIVDTIQYNYTINNWFDDITIENTEEGNIIIRFYHYMANKYSEILLKYFTNFFKYLNYDLKTFQSEDYFSIEIDIAKSI